MFPREAQLQSCLTGLVEALLTPPTTDDPQEKVTAQKKRENHHPLEPHTVELLNNKHRVKDFLSTVTLIPLYSPSFLHTRDLISLCPYTLHCVYSAVCDLPPKLY